MRKNVIRSLIISLKEGMMEGNLSLELKTNIRGDGKNKVG
jgi:hypothetical protein